MFAKACLLLVLAWVGFANTAETTRPLLSGILQIPQTTYDIAHSVLTDAGHKIFPSLTTEYPVDRYRRDDIRMKEPEGVKGLFKSTVDPVYESGKKIPSLPTNPRNRRFDMMMDTPVSASNVGGVLDSVKMPVGSTVLEPGKIMPTGPSRPDIGRSEMMMDDPKIVLDFGKTPLDSVKTSTVEGAMKSSPLPLKLRNRRTVIYEAPVVESQIFEPKLVEYPAYDPYLAYYNYYNNYYNTYPYYPSYAY